MSVQLACCGTVRGTVGTTRSTVRTGASSQKVFVLWLHRDVSSQEMSCLTF
jgi:hypothetical protein